MCYGFLSDDNAHDAHPAHIRFRNVSDDGISPLRVNLPTKLRERARAMAKHMRTNTTALIVAALAEKVDAFEAKRRHDEEMRRRDDEEKRGARRRGIALDLAPAREELAPVADDDASAASELDEDAALYKDYASKLMVMLERWSPVERRLAVGHAVMLIRNHHPLTSPPDHQILMRLEAEVARLRAERSPPPTESTSTAMTAAPDDQPQSVGSLIDRLFEPTARRIDPTRVQTFGAPPIAAASDSDE